MKFQHDSTYYETGKSYPFVKGFPLHAEDAVEIKGFYRDDGSRTDYTFKESAKFCWDVEEGSEDYYEFFDIDSDEIDEDFELPLDISDGGWGVFYLVDSGDQVLVNFDDIVNVSPSAAYRTDNLFKQFLPWGVTEEQITWVFGNIDWDEGKALMGVSGTEVMLSPDDVIQLFGDETDEWPEWIAKAVEIADGHDIRLHIEDDK